MKPYVRGRSVYFREVTTEDSEFILKLRTDPKKSRHLSMTSYDLDKQRHYIENYLTKLAEYYFIVCDYDHKSIGTVRIYDIRGDSFCWGSWVISEEASSNAAIESALMIYDFAFFALHYKKSHFDVRKENERVVNFHKRFGAEIVREDVENYYFEYSFQAYIETRKRHSKFLP